jgi:hypothetical protein
MKNYFNYYHPFFGLSLSLDKYFLAILLLSLVDLTISNVINNVKLRDITDITGLNIFLTAGSWLLKPIIAPPAVSG